MTELDSQSVRQRVHHSYIWLGGLHAFFIVLIAMIVSTFSSIISLIAKLDSAATALQNAMIIPLIIGATAVGLLVLFGLVVAVRAWSYKHLWYEVAPSEFNVCSGIFNKKRVHVPYQRVQSVDQRATLLQRIFGVCSVSIDTAGGSNNKAIIVPYVTKSQAESLRRELFARKQWAMQSATGAMGDNDAGAPLPFSALPTEAPGTSGASRSAASPSAAGSANILDIGDAAWQQIGGVFAGDAVFTGTVSYEYGLSNRELLLSGLSGNAGFVTVMIIVIVGLLQIASGLFDLFPGSGDEVIDIATGMAAQQGAEIVATWIAGAIIGIAIIGWVLSVLSTCLSYGGFHARRRDDRIEVERGLLQHQFQGVSVERVQSVEVKQSLIRRILGYCEITLGKVDASSDSNDGSSGKGTGQRGVVVHPFVKVDRVPEILHGLLPEFADLPTKIVSVAPVALRRALIRRCLWQGSGFWLAVCTIAAQASIHWLVGSDSSMAIDEAATMLGWTDMVATGLYVLAGVLLVLDIIGSILWFRESSFGTNAQLMSVTNGGFSTTTISFPRNKIQFGFTKANPFQRSARTATINARTAAGVGGTTVRLIDAHEADASAWLAWLKPGGGHNGTDSDGTTDSTDSE